MFCNNLAVVNAFNGVGVAKPEMMPLARYIRWILYPWEFRWGCSGWDDLEYVVGQSQAMRVLADWGAEIIAGRELKAGICILTRPSMHVATLFS